MEGEQGGLLEEASPISWQKWKVKQENGLIQGDASDVYCSLKASWEQTPFFRGRGERGRDGELALTSEHLSETRMCQPSSSEASEEYHRWWRFWFTIGRPMYDAIGCTTTAAWPEELAATADLVVCLPPRKKKEEEGRRQKRERNRSVIWVGASKSSMWCEWRCTTDWSVAWGNAGLKKSIVEDRDSTRSLGVFLSLRK